MTRENPKPDCQDVHFSSICRIDDAAEVALEDYARALSNATAAEVLRSVPEGIGGLHLCGVGSGLNAGQKTDMEAFARGLTDEGRTPRLGWS